MSRNIVHFNKTSNYKLEKFKKCVDSAMSDEGLELYGKMKEKAEEVFRILGDSYREEIYTSALAHELSGMGYSVETEVECDVIYKGESVGKIRADLVARGLSESFIVESKRVDCYKGVMQLIGYMRNLKVDIGFAIGFQKDKVSVWCVIDGYIYDGTNVRKIC